MKNILIAILFVIGMSFASYGVGYVFAYVGLTIEGLFTTYPENKYR